MLPFSTCLLFISVLLSSASGDPFHSVGALKDAPPAWLRDDCPFTDFEPCDCIAYFSEYFIYCQDVPTSQIHSLFQMSNVTNLTGLALSSDSFDYYCDLPDDLTANKLIRSILVTCSVKPLEQFNVAAFRSSTNFTTSLGLYSTAGLSNLNLSFLTQFPFLESLTLSGPLPSLQSMPHLPTLRSLYIYSADFRQWHSPELTPNLQIVELSNNAASSEELHRMLDFFIHYDQTLEILYFWNVSFNEFPSQIRSLSKLRLLDMRDVHIPRLGNGSVAIGSKLRSLILFQSDVETVEPGAFVGDFSECYIGLYDNRLTRFEEHVFRNLLESFTVSTSTVLLNSNPIECNCHLTWLIRDNRHLLPRVSSATCSNGTKFEDLHPDGFAPCTGSSSTIGVTSTEIKLPLILCLLPFLFGLMTCKDTR